MVECFTKQMLKQTQKRFKQTWIEQQENQYVFSYLNHFFVVRQMIIFI